MFDDYFEVYLANNEEAKRVHYNTKYQVYCEEMGFENKANFSENCERDYWDNHSVHFIVKMVPIIGLVQCAWFFRLKRSSAFVTALPTCRSHFK